jgi:hypothetical protein
LYLAAAIEFERRETGRAAVLLGAALRLMRRLDFQDELLLPNLANLGERLRASLGMAPFAEAVARGERLSLDDSTALLSMSGLADAR